MKFWCDLLADPGGMKRSYHSMSPEDHNRMTIKIPTIDTDEVKVEIPTPSASAVVVSPTLGSDPESGIQDQLLLQQFVDHSCLQPSADLLSDNMTASATNFTPPSMHTKQPDLADQYAAPLFDAIQAVDLSQPTTTTINPMDFVNTQSTQSMTADRMSGPDSLNLPPKRQSSFHDASELQALMNLVNDASKSTCNDKMSWTTDPTVDNTTGITVIESQQHGLAMSDSYSKFDTASSVNSDVLFNFGHGLVFNAAPLSEVAPSSGATANAAGIAGTSEPQQMDTNVGTGPEDARFVEIDAANARMQDVMSMIASTQHQSMLPTPANVNNDSFLVSTSPALPVETMEVAQPSCCGSQMTYSLPVTESLCTFVSTPEPTRMDTSSQQQTQVTMLLTFQLIIVYTVNLCSWRI